MTVVETLLALVLIPAAIYGLITLLALWPRLTRARYRAGQAWEFPPVFWVANPSGVSDSAPATQPELENTAQDAQRGTARGGARGNW